MAANNMIQFRLPQLPSLRWPSYSTAIPLPKPEIHSIEEQPEKRARTLKHLLKHNHITHSVIYNHLRFHNHTPHILGSAYIFGADSDQLSHIYDAESRHLESWADSPGEISKADWRDFLGKREYQRAWVDFFEDQLVEHGYDWHALLDEFLLQGKEPLINNVIAGLGHPLIHLGYAYELSSRTVAIESLALAACFRNEWHIYLDDPKYTKPTPQPTDSIFTVLGRVCDDKTFDGIFDGDQKGSDNISTLLANPTASAKMLEYWNSWDLKKPKEQFAESQKAAVALLVAAQSSSSNEDNSNNKKKKYDFFAVHLLNTSHALRTLLPSLPTSKHHLPLLRQWWLFTLLVYIAQLRPTINIDTIKLVELEGRDWNWISEVAVMGRYRTDAHFVKALRTMRECARTWGDGNGFYLKAAVKFAEKFEGWGGFGLADAELEAEEGSSGGEERTARRYSGQGDGPEFEE